MLFQNNINALITWSKTLDLKFNEEKCYIPHFGRANVKTKYRIGDAPVVSRIVVSRSIILKLV